MSKKLDRENKQMQFQELMAIIRRDPQKGLHLFYEEYGKIVQTTAQVICRSSDKVGEVIDDVFVKVWEYAKAGGKADNPEGLVYIVTANTAKLAMHDRQVLPLDENIAVAKDLIQEVID